MSVVNPPYAIQGQPTDYLTWILPPLTYVTDQCRFVGVTTPVTVGPPRAGLAAANPSAQEREHDITAMLGVYAGYMDDFNQPYGPSWYSPEMDQSATCLTTMKLDNYQYPVIQSMDYYGEALVVRAPSSVLNCRRSSGAAVTGMGSVVLALNYSIIGIKATFAWKPMDYGTRLEVQSIDGDVVCDGGTPVPPPVDSIFRDGFDRSIFANGFER